MAKVNCKVTPGATDICPLCKKEVELIKAKMYKKKPYHFQCYGELIDAIGKIEQKEVGESEINLFQYLCKIFVLSAMPVKMKDEIQEYIDKGFSYDNLYLTLYYMHEIIGLNFPTYYTLKIIDRWYDEAIEFWEHRAFLEEKSKEYDFENNITVVKGKPRNKKKIQEQKELQVMDLESMASQIEEQEKLHLQQYAEESKQLQEMQQFNREMLTIQKEFEDKRLPTEE